MNLQTPCVLALLVVNTAFAENTTSSTPTDVLNPTKLQVIPSAYGTGKHGEPKPLTALQRKVDATGRAVFPEGLVALPLPGSSNAPLPRHVAAQKKAMADLARDLNATPTWDAFMASVGGITRDLYRVATQEEGAKDVDPKYDKGVNRWKFRSKYGEEHWDEYERTVNQSQQVALIARLDEQARCEQLQRKSPAGAFLGRLFDPMLITGLLMVAFLFRRASSPKPVQLPSN